MRTLGTVVIGCVQISAGMLTIAIAIGALLFPPESVPHRVLGRVVFTLADIAGHT